MGKIFKHFFVENVVYLELICDQKAINFFHDLEFQIFFF